MEKKRIIKKKLAVNNEKNIKTVFVVDGIYIYPNEKSAKSMLNYLNKADC